ncbi:MAG: CPBP family intramembrane metalloprotease [Planctomycetota bacterium]|nr:MAG: CPBP family intramembrane metalloprotease [Planctomycetota bacterium]
MPEHDKDAPIAADMSRRGPWVAYFVETRRPRASLLLVAPLLLAGEALRRWSHGADAAAPALVATRLIDATTALIGTGGGWIPAAAVLATLFVLHFRHPPADWREAPIAPPLMLLESALLALPLIVVGRMMLAIDPFAAASWSRAVLAGVYEEFLFRLVLIGVALYALRRARLPGAAPAMIAALLSGVCFAAAHVAPLGGESPATIPLILRTLAGAYLGGVFMLRGFGLAVGAHVAHNLFVVSMFTVRS